MSDPGELWRLSTMAGKGHTAFASKLGGISEAPGAGRSRLRLPYSNKLIGNPDTGVVHGGVITGFLDQCCGMSVGSMLSSPRGFATLDLRIDYMKPAQVGREIIFEGHCLKIAREVAFTRGYAFHDSIDDPIAIATATFMFTSIPETS